MLRPLFAQVCVDRLNAKFPDSPRVKPLQGMLLEMEGHIELARLFYEKELLADEGNTVRSCLVFSQTADMVYLGATQAFDLAAFTLRRVELTAHACSQHVYVCTAEAQYIQAEGY